MTQFSDKILSNFVSPIKNLFRPKISNDYPHVLAAEVVGIDKHPDADRLRIIKLGVGDRIVGPVVCGAFNFKVGDIVALALPGAEIKQNIRQANHQSFILKRAAIRGVESQGMICSSFELGLGSLTEKPEIMILKNGVKPGSDFDANMIL